ncbi:putative extracellular salicylate hydroxylase/monooxygenase [Lasiosphaeria miniovina]|uniref:Extracellular salicylate hydroxylase/monooxygenase n=1 Tax=Lasiosphaeria miniovina TaxID=1954250 RepID=A0AA40AMK8_9PEZI|nr:putative extracellular salicylate hydroxylase/monooxygenase [Lasiosphaeria miniovina]KAK0718497.1 putative extracellular salicylate hydroxylase/monooxygenase [Lasiosphaeria miniovina]
MKIIVIGAGISGLATYLHLRKHLPSPRGHDGSAHTIHIYESHRPRSGMPAANDFDALSSSTAIVGGGLGVSPNGMRVLYDLDPDLHAAVAAQGFPCDHFIFMGRNGWTLGMQRTSDRGGFEGPEGRAEVCVSSSRHGLWGCLMARVEEGAVRYRRVVSVRAAGEGKKVVVFEDGGEEECDLVIGADGVKSEVRTALFGEDEEGEYSPQYTGASGIGGFINGPLPPRVADNKAMVFIFGRNGFFGYASASPAEADNLMWWSTFETDSLPSKTNLDAEEIKASLRERHRTWADPVVQDIISKAEVETIYPTWVLPNLPHYGENRIVLVGDAAHAMSPTTGQGASQALEDAQTLSLLLAETLGRAYDTSSEETETGAVALALKLFYEIRQPRVAAIVERGKKMDKGKGDVGVVAEYAMYCLLWVVLHFPSIGKGSTKFDSTQFDSR